MKRFLKIFGIIFIITAIFILGFFFDTEKNNVRNSIFDIYFVENVYLGENFGLDGKNISKLDYKQKIGKGVFIGEKNFLTAKHLFTDKNKKFFAKINNKFYNLKIIEKIKNKDLIVGEVINYKNNFNITKKSKIYKNEKVYLYKNNKKIYGKILEINKKISEFGLYNLIKINIKLEKGDSGTALFDENNNLIGICILLEKNKNISYAQFFSKKSRFY